MHDKETEKENGLVIIIIIISSSSKWRLGLCWQHAPDCNRHSGAYTNNVDSQNMDSTSLSHMSKFEPNEHVRRVLSAVHCLSISLLFIRFMPVISV